ncbi:MAG: permease [Chthoniobacteraceae bacterium]
MSWFNFNFHDFAVAFLSVLFEGIPFLLLGSLISGFVDVFVSSDRLAKMLPKNMSASILLAGLLGLIFPMCECGSVIVIRRFIRKGLPLSCAVTYMLGAPIVSPIVALSTFAAFKGQSPMEMTSLRLGMGYLIAVAAGFIIWRLRAEKILQPRMLADLPNRRSGLRFAAAPTAPNASERDFADVTKTASFPRRVVLAIQSATADFLDVAFFLVIGVALTSVFNTAINQEVILPFAENPPVAIVSLMGLAALLALCSTSDAFIAATFATFPTAAKLAFLVFGPMFDLKLFWLYTLIFKRRFVVLLSLALFVVIFLACWQLHGTILAPAQAMPFVGDAPVR